MNKIEELIQELCPEGVPYAPMGTVCKVFNGYAFKSELFNSLGDGVPLVRIRDLNTGLSGTFYSGEFDESYVVHDKDILIGMDGSFIPIRWKHGRALLNQRVCRIQDFSSDVVGDFLFYILKIELQSIEDNTQLSTVKHLSSRQLVDLRVPLPPLRVQQEIVSILDKFTELEAELEAELDAHTKQYESYRARALDFSEENNENPFLELIQEFCPGGLQSLELGELAEVKTGQATDEDWKSKTGQFPFMNGGTSPSGEVRKSNTPGGTIVIPSRGSVGRVAYMEQPFWCGPLSYRIRSIDETQATNKFVFYFLKNSEHEIVSLQQSGSIPALNRKELVKFRLALPPADVQKEIVSILDKFSELVKMLRAELDARRKQYECYRNKLLTFKELDAA